MGGYNLEKIESRLSKEIQGIATDSNVTLVKVEERPWKSQETRKTIFGNIVPVEERVNMVATLDVTRLNEQQIRMLSMFMAGFSAGYLFDKRRRN